MSSAAQVAWLIPLLPLAAGALIGLLLKSFNLTMNRLSKPVAVISLSSVGAAIIFSYALLSADGLNYQTSEQLITFGTLNQFKLELSYQVNPTSALLLTLTSIFSFVLMLISHQEMIGKKGYVRCFTGLCFFSGSLLGLAISANLAEACLFWLIIGVCSDQLIKTWCQFTNEKGLFSQGFLIHWIGDIALLFGTIDMLKTTGSINFNSISSTFSTAVNAATLNSNSTIILGILLVVAPLTKLTQLPLNIWQSKAQSQELSISNTMHDILLIGASVILIIKLQAVIDASAFVLTGSSLLQSIT